MQYFIHNGKIYRSGDASFSLNRAMLFGDGMFETIRIHNSEILFLEDHIDRLLAGMKALRIKTPYQYTSFFFHKQILDLGHMNEVGAHARIRITVYRAGKGLYEPE